MQRGLLVEVEREAHLKRLHPFFERALHGEVLHHVALVALKGCGIERVALHVGIVHPHSYAFGAGWHNGAYGFDGVAHEVACEVFAVVGAVGNVGAFDHGVEVLHQDSGVDGQVGEPLAGLLFGLVRVLHVDVLCADSSAALLCAHGLCLPWLASGQGALRQGGGCGEECGGQRQHEFVCKGFHRLVKGNEKNMFGK